jgi:hypothetical protein
MSLARMCFGAKAIIEKNIDEQKVPVKRLKTERQQTSSPFQFLRSAANLRLSRYQ